MVAILGIKKPRLSDAVFLFLSNIEDCAIHKKTKFQPIQFTFIHLFRIINSVTDSVYAFQFIHGSNYESSR